MSGITLFGAVHTLIGVVAVVAGFVALARDKAISVRSGAGLVFIWGTVATCVTALGIFRHGGVGVPHAFAIATLLILAVAAAAEIRESFGRASPYVATVSYSLALFLHFIPATVETLTRLPAGAPYLANPDDPRAQPIIGAFFLIFLAGVTLQVLRLRASLRPAAA